MAHFGSLTRVLIVLGFALACLQPGLALPNAYAADRAISRAQSSPEMTGAILAALNEWRITQQLWPLRPNPTLEALALQQALYLQGLGDALPDDRIHEGPDGSDPPARARRAGWPTYGRDDFTAITEIGKIGPNAADAMAFWTTSNTHLRAISNPVYREIGIAAVPHRYGFITIVLLGARPDVLPALVDDEARTLFLSNERYRGSSGFTYLAAASRVRLFDASGRPLQDTWIDWQPTLALPAGTGSPIIVAYTDGTRQTVAIVDLARDRVTGPLNEAAPMVSAPPGSVATPTPVPAPAAAAMPPAPAVTPAPAATPNIRIVYDTRSLAVINLTNARQDWSGLALVQGANQLSAMRWDNLGGFAMASVPPHACIQAVDPALAAFAAPPSGCTSYYAVLEMGSAERFWTTNGFEVQADGQVIANCPAQTGPCEVTLP